MSRLADKSWVIDGLLFSFEKLGFCFDPVDFSLKLDFSSFFYAVWAICFDLFVGDTKFFW